MTISDAKGIISDLQDHFERMSQGERTFVEQLSERFERYPQNVHVSPNEIKKLELIQDKYLR